MPTRCEVRLVQIQVAHAQLQSVLYYFAEVRNQRNYLSGTMGELSASDIINLDNRVNNTLIKAVEQGADGDLLLTYAVDHDKAFPQFTYDLLLHLCCTAEAALDAWAASEPSRFHDKVILNKKELIDIYVHSRRHKLRRYASLSRAELKSWLPKVNLNHIQREKVQ